MPRKKNNNRTGEPSVRENGWYDDFCKLLVDIDPDLASTGGEDTFAYVLLNCRAYGGITKRHWEDSTQKQYAEYYKTYLIPGLSVCPMEELTKASCDKLLEDIQKKRQKNFQKLFSNSTINQLRYLIRIVFDKAVEMGVLNENCLWGSPDYAAHIDTEERSEANAKERVILRKSLTPKEEKSIYGNLLLDPTQNGYMMALAMMFSLGLRNAEACGATFGNFRELSNYPRNYALYIATTTIGNTSEIKTGGKTPNAPRKLPVPNSLAMLIRKRRKYLIEKIQNGEIVLGEGQKSVEDLPIACLSRKRRVDQTNTFVYEDDFTTHCRSGDLTRYGKGLLASVGLAEAEVAYIEKQMDKSDGSDVELKEKDPTVYLFRRNLGTHLSLLGLSQTEIEAVMGHSIIDEEVDKNDLENDDLVYQIKKKMDERPIFNDEPPSSMTEELADQPVVWNAVSDCRVRIYLKKDRKAHLHITTREQGDSLTIKYNAKRPKELITIDRTRSYIPSDNSDEVSIIKMYREMYKE